MRSVLFIFILCAGVIISAQAQNAVWKLNKSSSGVGFAIEHMITDEAHGQFREFQADVKSDQEDFSDAKVTFTILTASISTGDEKRDGHLRSADFFHADKYKQIVFVSTSFKKIKGRLYELRGNLAMNGITKPVVFKARFDHMPKGSSVKNIVNIKVYGEIDRYLWDLKYNSKLETGGMILGQNVRIACNLELIKA